MRNAIFAIFLVTFASIINRPLYAAVDVGKSQELIERAISAMGDNKALEKSRNTIIEDEGIHFGTGRELKYKGRYVYKYGDSGRYRIEIIGAFVHVTDRDNGWTSFMGNTTELERKILEVAIREMFVSYVVTLLPLQKSNGKFKLSMADPETVEGEKCEGEKCEGIHIERDKMRKITMHFSGQTGLIKKTSSVKMAADLNFKEVKEEAFFQEYKEFAGFKSPTKITVYRNGKKFTESRRQKITHPDTIDESEFRKPE